MTKMVGGNNESFPMGGKQKYTYHSISFTEREPIDPGRAKLDVFEELNGRHGWSWRREGEEWL